jgi:hypothetical protein
MRTHCGVTVDGEIGTCRRHLAEQYGVKKARIQYLVQTGELEAHPAQVMWCTTHRRGNCLIPEGSVQQGESSIGYGGWR